MSAAAAPGTAVRRDGAIGSVPGSWTQTFLMSRYQFRDYLRSQRFLLMMGIVAAISAILLTLVGYYRPAGLVGSAKAFYASLWIEGTEVLIVFAGIIFGGDAIAGEFQNRTGYFLMGQPIKRWSVYAGKYLAAFAAALVTIAVYLVVLVLAGAYFLGSGAFPPGLFAAFAIAVLYLAALLGTTFLFSSLFKTSMYGVIVVAIMFLFGFSLIEGVIEGLVGITPWFIITWANVTIAYPITNVPAHAGARLGLIVQYPTYAQGLSVMFAYFLGTTIAGLLLFDREEFT